MSALLLTVFSVLGLSGILLQARNDERFVQFFYLLIFLAFGLFLSSGLTEEENVLLFSAGGMTAIHFVLSRFGVFQNGWLRAVPSIVLLVVFVLLFNGQLEDLLGHSAKFLLGGMTLAVISFEAVRIKSLALSKLSSNDQLATVLKGVMLFFLAGSIFMGDFASPGLGVLLVGFFFLGTAFYYSKNYMRYALIYAFVASFSTLMGLSSNPAGTLANGDVLQGAVLGLGAGVLLIGSWSFNAKRVLLIPTVYLIAIGVGAGVLYLESIYANMGGMDAFVAFLFGALIAQLLKGEGKEYAVSGWLMIMLAIGTWLPSQMVNEEEQAFFQQEQVTTGNTEEEVQEPEEVVVSMAGLTGKYELLSDSSRVTFKLGKKGETKGAFKKVSGNVVFDSEMENTSLTIDLDLDNFTTFNSFRDKSLMGDGYFKQDQFPTMKFKGNKLVEKGTNIYEVQGDFTMLGKTNAVPVTIKRIESGSEIIIVGKGEIDRTKFGMKSSKTEGNIVSFEYRATLVQK